MKYRAVIFDLFLTLTEHLPVSDFDRALSEMAAAVEAPRGDFANLWRKTLNQRMGGAFPTVRGEIEHVCQALSVHPEPAAIDAAARIRTDFTRRELALRPEVIETLNRLRQKGYKTGVVTNCASVVPTLWAELPLAPLIDTVIFSSQERILKPDPRIYELACERLAVTPQDCLYVGDGAGGELTGASQVGMQPVRIRVAGEERYFTDTAAEQWEGLTILSLAEVLELLED
jgi:putative hydrolase of the HAD superfamily